MADVTPIPHTWQEDIQALLVSTLFMALSVTLFRHAGLLTGGTAGLAFLLHYLSGYAFGPIFFVINLPFYIFAVRALGWAFTFKTFAAIMAGLLAGVGLLMLMRHRASLGGIGVLAIYLQEKHGWRAGKVQMAADCAIVLAALLIKDFSLVILSILGAVALNLVIAVNHRPGRYLGF